MNSDDYLEREMEREHADAGRDFDAEYDARRERVARAREAREADRLEESVSRFMTPLEAVIFTEYMCSGAALTCSYEEWLMRGGMTVSVLSSRWLRTVCGTV